MLVAGGGGQSEEVGNGMQIDLRMGCNARSHKMQYLMPYVEQ
jgi:hypothetical protein